MEHTNGYLIPTGVERCPYLGLHDDPGTSLAYCSNWNYCHHAHPPASVLISHQGKTCLTPEHACCPVYLSPALRPLPPDLRGAARVGLPRPGTLKKFAAPILILLLIVVVVLAVTFGRDLLFTGNVNRQVSNGLSLGASPVHEPTDPISTVTLNLAYLIQAGSMTADSSTRIADRTSIANSATSSIISTGTIPVTRTPSRTPTRRATLTLTPSRTPTKTASAALTPSRVPSPTLTSTMKTVQSCGYPLDTSFGSEKQFVVHRVISGENLSMYADRYHTSADAIMAVNYRLPTPIWLDWIIVIPVGTTEVTGIPPFETYQALGRTISLEELAHQLETDPQSLRKYNAFEEPCEIFSGWLLVPR